MALIQSRDKHTGAVSTCVATIHCKHPVVHRSRQAADTRWPVVGAGTQGCGACCTNACTCAPSLRRPLDRGLLYQPAGHGVRRSAQRPSLSGPGRRRELGGCSASDPMATCGAGGLTTALFIYISYFVLTECGCFSQGIYPHLPVCVVSSLNGIRVLSVFSC